MLKGFRNSLTLSTLNTFAKWKKIEILCWSAQGPVQHCPTRRDKVLRLLKFKQSLPTVLRLSLIILQKFPFHSVKRTIMHLNQNLFSSKICYSLLGSIHCVISRLTAKSLHLLILSLLGAKTICHQLVVTGGHWSGHWSGHMCNYLTWWIWPAQWGVTDSSIVSIPGQTSCRNWQLLIKNSHDFNWSQWSSVLAPTPQINSLLRSLLPTLYL